MIFKTIKLNREYWQKKIPFLRYGVPNPLQVFSKDAMKFSDAMASFRFSGVAKTTRADRHIKTQIFLKKYIADLQKSPVILDIGASDGTTSLELIEKVNSFLKKYYVTDYNIKCNYLINKGYTFFFNQSDECFLVASNKFVFYPESKRLFNFLFKKKLAKLDNIPKTELLLCNHNLKAKANTDERIEIMTYNIFEPWRIENPDIIIVGNLLNDAYFTNDQIFKALQNCYNAMQDNGILTIIRNTILSKDSEIELSAIYKKNTALKRFQQIFDINGGTEINEFVLSLQFS